MVMAANNSRDVGSTMAQQAAKGDGDSKSSGCTIGRLQ